MVISHKHRYVFLELPYTATRAISRELREHYDGEEILCKHSNYPEFVKYASAAEREYRVLCGIRNPLQIPISLYLKYRNTPITDLWLGDLNRDRWNPVSNLYDRMSRPQVLFAKREDCSFDDFFLKYYRFPYDNWSRVSIPHCDVVLRFESLQSDFSRALDHLGISQVRELPRKGNAVSWSHDPASYYGERSRARAVRVFGPYMRRWQYEFPESWGEARDSVSAELLDNVLAMGRVPYWTWVRGLLDVELRRRAKCWVHRA
ncbi:MAG: hypothetical protein RIC56_01425 [Pseudomonadales bacterium]